MVDFTMSNLVVWRFAGLAHAGLADGVWIVQRWIAVQVSRIVENPIDFVQKKKGLMTDR
jgi:hypothetical protein